MGKGVSAILASVLIVLVSVALAGTFLTYTQRTGAQLFAASEERQQATQAQTDVSFAIEAVANNKVSLRNTGNSDISYGTVSIFLDDILINYTLPTAIPPGQTGEVLLNDTGKAGGGQHTMRISSGALSDNIRVNVEKPQGLILHLQFDEGAGDVLTDSSGTHTSGITVNDHNITLGDWLFNPVQGSQAIYGTSPTTNNATQRFSFYKDGNTNTTNNLVMRLRKVGAPTGTATIRFSPTLNSGGVTIPLDVSTLPTSFVDRTFTLPDYPITRGTFYYLSIEYSGGDISNKIEWAKKNADYDWAESGADGVAINSTSVSGDMMVRLTASAQRAWVNGRWGKAIEHHYRITDSNAPPAIFTALTGDKTIEAWIYRYSNVQMGIFHSANTAAPPVSGYGFVLTATGQPRLYLGDNINIESESATGAAALNAWSHIAMVYHADTDAVDFYVDGQLAGTSTFTLVTNHGGGWFARVGSEDSRGGEWGVDGILDEVRVYDRALDANEIGKTPDELYVVNRA